MTLEALDRRSVAYRDTVRNIAALTADAGGADQVSAAEQLLIKRAAIMAALLEDVEAKWLRSGKIEARDYSACTNTLRRTLEAIGLKRRARDVTPTLDDIAAEIEQEREAEERAAREAAEQQVTQPGPTNSSDF
jgi:hypothetical protein